MYNGFEVVELSGELDVVEVIKVVEAAVYDIPDKVDEVEERVRDEEPTVDVEEVEFNEELPSTYILNPFGPPQIWLEFPAQVIEQRPSVVKVDVLANALPQ